MNEQEQRAMQQLLKRQRGIHVHACWRDEECQSYGAPKRLYINSYFGSLQFGKWSVHFRRANRKRGREWLEDGIKSGKVQILSDGSTLVKLDKPIEVPDFPGA